MLALIDFDIIAVVFTLLAVTAGLKSLGVLKKPEGGIFEKNKEKGSAGTLTLTEMFQKTQTKFHAILIMYIMLAVVALTVVLKVLPWQVLFFLTVILMALSDRKNFLRIKYIAFLIFSVIIIGLSLLCSLPALTAFTAAFTAVKWILAIFTVIYAIFK